jgi:hypothetical protein
MTYYIKWGRIEMTSSEKTLYRKNKEWKLFSQKLRKEHPYCHICGGGGRLQVHHGDEAHYTDLNPKKFLVLCSICHKWVSNLDKKNQIQKNRASHIAKYYWAIIDEIKETKK